MEDLEDFEIPDDQAIESEPFAPQGVSHRIAFQRVVKCSVCGAPFVIEE